MRGMPATGSAICRPASTANTIWLLRSVRNSLACSFWWRADCFQSIARRSIPLRYSTSASKSVPSPRSSCVISPCNACRWNSRAPCSRTGRISGRIASVVSVATTRRRQASPSGPRHRIQTCEKRAVPRRRVSTGNATAPRPASSGTSARPSSARSTIGSAASAISARRAAPRGGIATVTSASTPSPTLAVCGRATVASTRRGAIASTPSISVSTMTAAGHASATAQ